jgi:GNAT superfamily N-acetyltransferase
MANQFAGLPRSSQRVSAAPLRLTRCGSENARDCALGQSSSQVATDKAAESTPVATLTRTRTISIAPTVGAKAQRMAVFENATSTDASEIASLVNAAYRAQGTGDGWTNERELVDGHRINEKGVRSLIERGRVLAMRHSTIGRIAGCINIAVDADGAWHISMLAVSPSEQTGGIGKAIEQEVERQAVADGAPRMRLEVIRQRGTLIE